MEGSQGQVTAKSEAGVEPARNMIGRLAKRNAEATERDAEEGKVAN